MSWFEDWFDADYLQVFGPYVDGDRARTEAADVLALLGLPDGSVVLDLACGQGRHAAPLREAGLRVVGLDLSEVLLHAAHQRDPALPLVRADMRALPLRPAAVDGVVSLFNAFGYFDSDDEDRQVLAEVARVLRPGGTFVQEVHHRDALVVDWEPRTTHPRYEDGLVVTEERTWDPVAGRHRVTFLLQAPNGEVRRREHELRVYTLTELVAMHREAGLQVHAVHGDLRGAAPTPQTPLCTVVSTRAA